MRRAGLAAAALSAVLTGCACKPERVEVPVLVEMPGEPAYVPVPATLLAGPDVGEPPAKGQPLEAVFEWVGDARLALAICHARLEAIGRLGSDGSVW
jgi:hypothetical protein